MQLAEKAHEGQVRTFQGVPYVWHPHSVSKLVEMYSRPEHDVKVLRTVAMLHDVVEDCNVELSEIKKKFGKDVRDLVEELTSDQERIDEIGKTEYLKEAVLEMSDDALFVKLCDRLDNVSDLRLVHDDFRERYIRETEDILSYLYTHRELTSSQLAVYSAIRDFLK